MEDLDIIVLNSKHWELDDLADFIVTNHHQYVRKSVLAINAQCEKVVHLFTLYHRMESVIRVFQKVAIDLCLNMNEEEQILFPYIRFQVQIKKGNIDSTFLPPGSIKERIDIMEKEHAVVQEGIECVRKLSMHYHIPEHACPEHVLLIQSLKEFDNDLAQHFRLESNLLFLKALQLEKDYLEKPVITKQVASKLRTQPTSVIL